MKPSILLHCSDPRLGRGPGPRADDRVAALRGVVREAMAGEVSAVLVAGRLFEPGLESTDALRAVETDLARLASAGIPLITTVDAGSDPVAAYLASRQLIVALAANGADLATLDLGQELRIVGLGRPRSRAAIEERVAAVPQRARGGALVLLIDASSQAFELDLLEPARVRATYIAVGGLPTAQAMRDSALDPGPLVRSGPTADDEPGFVRVTLQAKRVTIDHLSSEDRGLVIASIDACRDTRTASPETQLREQLRGFDRKSRPLLRIEVRDHGPEPTVGETELIAVARKLIDPVQWVVRIDRGSPDERTREDLERSVCEEYARNRADGFARMALSAFDLALEAGPNHVDRIAALVAGFIAKGRPVRERAR